MGRWTTARRPWCPGRPDRGPAGVGTAWSRSGPPLVSVAIVLVALTACDQAATPADEPTSVAVTATTTTETETETEAEAAGDATTAGVEVFGDRSRDHVEGAVDYDQDPPIGGAHAAVWQNCGAYDQPIADENGVHSLEHGAVWITYDPGLSADEVNQLWARAAVSTHVLVSPRDGLPSPVVASAWSTQLQLDRATDERLDDFLATYVQGPQTPEPGVTCADGVGNPR